MAQLDVYVNLDVGRRTYPLLLAVQNRRFEHLRTRLVIPLLRATAGERWRRTEFIVDGVLYALAAHDLFPAPDRILGPCVGSLGEHGTEIIHAIDEVISVY